MSSTNEPWFVAERSEALAGVLLTSRKDVRIRDERKHDSGLDFLFSFSLFCSTYPCYRHRSRCWPHFQGFMTLLVSRIVTGNPKM